MAVLPDPGGDGGQVVNSLEIHDRIRGSEGRLRETSQGTCNPYPMGQDRFAGDGGSENDTGLPRAGAAKRLRSAPGGVKLPPTGCTMRIGQNRGNGRISTANDCHESHIGDDTSILAIARTPRPLCGSAAARGL